jgi:hypothetical protein
MLCWWILCTCLHMVDKYGSTTSMPKTWIVMVLLQINGSNLKVCASLKMVGLNLIYLGVWISQSFMEIWTTQRPQLYWYVQSLTKLLMKGMVIGPRLFSLVICEKWSTMWGFVCQPYWIYEQINFCNKIVMGGNSNYLVMSYVGLKHACKLP